MSLIQSTAALPKGHIVRWLAPAVVYAFGSTAPGCKRSGLWAGQMNNTQQARYFHKAKNLPQKKSPKWQKPGEGKLFSEDYCPPLEWWEETLDAFEAEDLTPQACHYAATQYCAVAVTPLSTWKGRLERDYGIDNFTLHCMGVMLIQSKGPQQFGKLGWHMLKTASDLNYDRSTVTLMRILTSLKNKGAEIQKQLETITPRFEKIVRSGCSDPEALTVKGKLLAAMDKPEQALACFDQAIQAAVLKEQSTGTPTTDSTTTATGNAASTNRAPRWPMEADCHLRRAWILTGLGRLDEATDSLRVAALELDVPEAYAALSLLMAKGSQVREDYLLKAAVSGLPEAYPRLAELETKKAEALDPGDPRRRDHQILAAEWSRLAQSGDQSG